MHLDFTTPWQDPVLVFALILFIVLLVPIALERIKVPAVLGYIIAGIFIGEHGGNLISRSASIELFGTVGILYLMFIAGLEIDINEFIKNKTKGIIFGVSTVLFPLVLGVPIFYYGFGYGLAASFLIGAIFVSHTLVTYPLVSKAGITKNLAVNISVAGTLIADVVALLMLAVITNQVSSSFEVMFWVRFVISILIFGGIMFVVIPYISRWFFKHISDNILQYIFVLSIVFLSALLAMLAGLEPLVGAFFAGLSLNRLIPHTSPLMNRIDFIGNAIFIPFFLIGVGMLINYKVLFQSFNALYIAFVMTAIGVISKYLAAISTRYTAGLSANQGLLIFGLTNARVAASLAIALIGFEIIIGQTPEGNPIHLLDEDIFNAVIIMILITSTISSFVTQSVSKKIIENDLQSNVPQPHTQTENILIGLANEATAENLINLAITTLYKKDSQRIYGLHIITDKNENLKRAEKLMAQAKKHTAATDIYLKPVIRYDINVASGIIHTIKERQIDHFFIGLHEKASILGNFFGNLTNDLLKQSRSTIYINKMYQPINTVKKFVVIVSPKAHLEPRFAQWFKRIMQISITTGNKITLYASAETDQYIQMMKVHADYDLKTFGGYNDLLIISKDIQKDSMLIFGMARKDSISYENAMDKTTSHIVKYFNQVSFMLVYPSH